MKIHNHRLVGDDGAPVPFRLSPNHGGPLVPEILVMHDTASPLNAAGPISWLTDPQSKVSAHLVIDRNGAITQLVPFNSVAWHAGKSSYRGRSGVNAFSIGFEFVNPGAMSAAPGDTVRGPGGHSFSLAPDSPYSIRRASDHNHPDAYWMDYTDKQIEAGERAAVAIARAYKITDVVAHWTVSPGRKVDTNPFFPLAELRAKVLGEDHDDEPGVVTLVAVNLRRWPSYNDNIIGVIAAGCKLTVLRAGRFTNNGNEEEWYLVRYMDDEGWVNASCVEHV